jgi:hypothetical protein
VRGWGKLRIWPRRHVGLMSSPSVRSAPQSVRRHRYPGRPVQGPGPKAVEARVGSALRAAGWGGTSEAPSGTGSASPRA